MPQVDLVRAVFTYATALVTVLGGGAMIFVSRGDPAATDTIAIMAGFVGVALNFLFGAEVQTRTARQAAASTAAAASVTAATAAAANGHPVPPPPPIDDLG
jgi:hypothetical protein